MNVIARIREKKCDPDEIKALSSSQVNFLCLKECILNPILILDVFFSNPCLKELILHYLLTNYDYVWMK